MFNKQLKTNIRKIDERIEVLIEQLDALEDNSGDEELLTSEINELTKIRKTLSENKVSESYLKEVIQLVGGFGAIALVLKYEKTEIITSKAFGLATSLFRGR